MAITIRPVSDEQVRDFHVAMGHPFGFDPTKEDTERFERGLEPLRLQAAFDGEEIVGTFGAYDLEMTVPGGCVPTSGVTVVTVMPTHRRQGVLRRLMTEHFRELRETGREPLAALWASEATIYGRFGFSPAVEGLFRRPIAKSRARLREPVDLAGTMRLVKTDEAIELIAPIFDAVRRERAGMFARDLSWWRHGTFEDPAEHREGASAIRCVVHERAGRAVGYVLYRTKFSMTAGEQPVRVRELVGLDADAERALWQFVFGIDLSTRIEYENLPVDTPLTWWLEDSRALERQVEDTLWLRLIDVPTALEGRRYAAAGSVVMAVRDEVCPRNEGVHRLDVDAEGRATCRTVTDEPEIETDVAALASIYLGGHRLCDLARGGRFRGSADALRRADTMFGWHQRPWVQEVF